VADDTGSPPFRRYDPETERRVAAVERELAQRMIDGWVHDEPDVERPRRELPTRPVVTRMIPRLEQAGLRPRRGEGHDAGSWRAVCPACFPQHGLVERALHIPPTGAFSCFGELWTGVCCRLNYVDDLEARWWALGELVKRQLAAQNGGT